MSNNGISSSDKNHKNNANLAEYNVLDYFSSWLKSTKLMTTVNILVNSNDNFILRWYYDKLIRLPIKVNTL